MAPDPLLEPAFHMPAAVRERARAIRLVLFDVDGVLTDGRVILGAEDEYKAFDIKDGHGLKMLQDNGITVGIVTGRTSRALERRAAELGVRRVQQGCSDKPAVCEQWLADLALAPEHAAFLGDDVPDLPLLGRVGLSIAPHDAHPLVKRQVHWVTPSAGGRGAAREACELILHAQGRYAATMRRYSSGAARDNSLWE